jgi:hypothetical protein
MEAKAGRQEGGSENLLRQSTNYSSDGREVFMIFLKFHSRQRVLKRTHNVNNAFQKVVYGAVAFF